MPSTPPSSVLLCRVGSMRIAIDAAEVREVLPLLPLWRPPTLPRPLAGFMAVRGEVLPVLAPAALFGSDAGAATVDAYAHIVRPHGASATWPCLLVDRVDGMIHPAAEAVKEVAVTASFNGTVVAEVETEAGPAHLVSLAALLDRAERARLAALADEAARRASEWAMQETA